jgi:glucokinase
MSNDFSTRLLGDVGGTHARFAWQSEPGVSPTLGAVYRCASHSSIAAAIEHYLLDHQLGAPRDCAIGIATPVIGDFVKMTNNDWSFSIAALKAQFGFARLVVINDFTALALALPALGPGDLCSVGSGAAIEGAPKALLGAGTGLGVSGLIQDAGGRWVPIAGEGGHVTLAAHDDQEAAIIAYLRAKFGHVSAERVLSGPGLVNLHEALAGLSGLVQARLQPADVLANAAQDALCAQAVAIFCAFLGSTAGDLALTLGSRGGVYIGGGIAPRILPQLQASRFRERFEAKGRFQSYLAAIPTAVVVTAQSPALLGVSRALDA